MLEWLGTWRPIFETLYFIASIGLFATVIIGLKQLRLVKKDMFDRTKRAAVEKSIEYLNYFATGFIPKFNEFREHVRNAGIQDLSNGFNTSFSYTHSYNLNDATVVDRLEKQAEFGGLSLANELEFFAAAIRSGLADEELVFSPVAHLMCESVEYLFPVYCEVRKESDSSLFTHTIELYKMWRARLNQIEEQKEKRRQEEASKLSDQRIRSIGM